MRSPAGDTGFVDHPVHGARAQYAEICKVVSLCPRMRVAIDVGAHVGIWSAALIGQGFNKVHAFEPFEGNHDCLVENVAALGAVTAYQVALGDAVWCCELKLPARGNSGMWYAQPGGDVPMRTMDSYAFRNVDLVKIDVEGYEGEVLNGALSTIFNYKPVIVFEDNGNGPKYYGDSWVDPKKVLKGLGYKRRMRIQRDEVWLPE